MSDDYRPDNPEPEVPESAKLDAELSEEEMDHIAAGGDKAPPVHEITVSKLTDSSSPGLFR